MNEVVANIRSALISTKGSTELRTLQRDYVMLTGDKIPYQKFGYSTLEQFLKNIPTINVSKTSDGRIFVDAVATKKSSHIADLVNKQRTARKKLTRKAQPPRHQRMRFQSNSNWFPVTTGKKWSPIHQTSARVKAVAHNQIVVRNDWSLPRSLLAYRHEYCSDLRDQIHGQKRHEPSHEYSDVRQKHQENRGEKRHEYSDLRQKLEEKREEKRHEYSDLRQKLQEKYQLQGEKYHLPSPRSRVATNLKQNVVSPPSPEPKSLSSRLLKSPEKSFSQEPTREKSYSQVPTREKAYSPVVPTREKSFSPVVPTREKAYSPVEPTREKAYSPVVPTREKAFSPVPSKEKSFLQLPNKEESYLQLPSKVKALLQLANKDKACSQPQSNFGPSNMLRLSFGPSERLKLHQKLAQMSLLNFTERPKSRMYSTLSQNSSSTSSLQFPAPVSDQQQKETLKKEPIETLPKKVAVFDQDQIDALREDGLAHFDSESAVFNWSSSEDGQNGGDGQSSGDGRNVRSPCTEYPVTPLSKLKAFAKMNNLGEVICKVMHRQRKTKSIYLLYVCQMKISSHSYTSYPDDCDSPIKAIALAAVRALNGLEKILLKQREKKTFLSTENDILERIPPMIQTHFSGVWASQLALDYEEIFKEQLPSNWLTLLDTLPTISVDLALENKFVLRYCKIGDKNQIRENWTPDVSIPSNTVHLTEEGWYIQITCALSTIEVWCRQVDTLEAESYEQMTSAMEEYYEVSGEFATNVKAGGFYVVRFEDCWCRVRALKVNEHDVNCFFIDYGDTHDIPRRFIYVLERQFAKEQAQVFVCRLAGLEELVNLSCTTDHLSQIVAKNYFAKPAPNQTNENNENEYTDQTISIVLYEVTDDKQENVNRELIKKITIDSTSCDLEKNKINKVFVTHSEPNGDIYVQVRNEGFEKILEIMNTFHDINFEEELPNSHYKTSELPNEIYLIKWAQDKQYYRCTIEEILQDGKNARIYFVDYGNTDIINVESNFLYPVHLISDILSLYPYQAVKVRLEIDRLPSDFTDQIAELLPPDELALLKILSHTNDKIPICSIFKRLEENKGFISIGFTLKMNTEVDDSEEMKNDDKTTELTKKLERLMSFSQKIIHNPVPSTGELKAPKQPLDGSYVDVTVTLALNPWNFFLQPFEMANQFTQLMTKLQLKYKDITHSPIEANDVIPGKIYAAKFEDGFWYRISVIKIVHSGSISVYYVDFGSYSIVTLKQLVPLDLEFLDFPYQAMKAKLYGIKPKYAKWTMDDCQYFAKLVCKKNFVAVFLDKQKDESYKLDDRLLVKLYDTSTENDICINKLLILKGIAVQDI